MMMPKVIRLKEVVKLTGLAASTIWRREQEGVFPPRFHLGGRAVGWLYEDVVNWLEVLVQQGEWRYADCKAKAGRLLKR